MSFFGLGKKTLAKLFEGSGVVSGDAASTTANRVLATPIIDVSKFNFLNYQFRCAAPTANLEIAVYMLSGTSPDVNFEALVTAPQNRNGQISYPMSEAGDTVSLLFMNSAVFPQGATNIALNASVGTLADSHENSVRLKIASMYPNAWSAQYASTTATDDPSPANYYVAPFGNYVQMLLMYKPLIGSGPDTIEHRLFGL